MYNRQWQPPAGVSDVLTGPEAAERAGFLNLKCNVVLIGTFNDGKIKDFIALTEPRPRQIRFIELMPMGQCADRKKVAFSRQKRFCGKSPLCVPVSPPARRRATESPAQESADIMRAACPIPLTDDIFAENINTMGIALKHLPVGTRLRIGNS